MDGTWLNFSFASVRALPFSSWSQLLALAGGIAAVMILGVGAMRLITRPIESLASAAEELGRGARPRRRAGSRPQRGAPGGARLQPHASSHPPHDRGPHPDDRRDLARPAHADHAPAPARRVRRGCGGAAEDAGRPRPDGGDHQVDARLRARGCRYRADLAGRSARAAAGGGGEPSAGQARDERTVHPARAAGCAAALLQQPGGERDPLRRQRRRSRSASCPTRSRSPSTMPAPASRKIASRTSSARSCGWRNRATAIPAVPASASPSRAASYWRMAGP